jgi:hypothetical protein
MGMTDNLALNVSNIPFTPHIAVNTQVCYAIQGYFHPKINNSKHVAKLNNPLTEGACQVLIPSRNLLHLNNLPGNCTLTNAH